MFSETPLNLSAQHREWFYRDIGQRLQDHMAQSGYRAADAPIIQDAGLFLTRAGDQLINHLFTFEHRGHVLALRPEFTTPALQRYLSEYGALPAPPIVRWQFQGAVFEDFELTQRQQHLNIGAELIGMSSLFADAESIALAFTGLAACGIRNAMVRIGHVQLVRMALTCLNIDARTQSLLLQHVADLCDPARGRAYVLEKLEQRTPPGDQSDAPGDMLDTNAIPAANSFDSSVRLLETMLTSSQRQDTMGGRTHHEIVQRLMTKRQRKADHAQIARALDLLEQWMSLDRSIQKAFAVLAQSLPDSALEGPLHELHQLVLLLGRLGVPEAQIRIQPALPRNWEYYTGAVFQIEGAPASPEGQVTLLASGGRYDDLARLLGAPQPVPAVGFVYYVNEFPIAEPLDDEGVITLHAQANAPPQDIVQWSHWLRARGLAIQVGIGAPCAHTRIELVLNGEGALLCQGQWFNFAAREALYTAIVGMAS